MTEDHLRYMPMPLLEELRDWCAREAETEPELVVLIGLALSGLNEHQIASARVEALEPVCVSYPLARREEQTPAADRQSLLIDGPEWFARSIRASCDRRGVPGPVVVTPQPSRRMFSPRPRDAEAVRRAVRETTERVTGRRIGCSLIARSSIEMRKRTSAPDPTGALGYAPGYDTRLVLARPEPVLPKQVRR